MPQGMQGRQETSEGDDLVPVSDHLSLARPRAVVKSADCLTEVGESAGFPR